MPTGHPRIGRTRDELEQDRIAAEMARREMEADDAALSKPPVELSPRERAREEAEKRAMLDALKDTRPRRPALDAPAPESINPRVKPAPEPEPEPVAVVEPVVPLPDPQLSEATARQLEAQARLVAAEVELAEADRVLAQAQADHAAQEADRQLQRHRAILVPALAAAQRRQADFQRLFDVYGGAGRGGTTHGPLARLAKTLPAGYDVQRRERLAALYQEAGQLMERIRLGFQAAVAVVTACETALTVGGSGDYAGLRLELAQRACEEASAHDPHAVRAACEQLLNDVKAVDGEPGPEEVVVYLDGPRREAVKSQRYAEGIGGSILPS